MKKIIVTIITFMLVFFMTTNFVLALPSITVGGTVVGNIKVDGVVEDQLRAVFVNDFLTNPVETKMIKSLNSGESLNEVLNNTTIESAFDVDLSEYSLLTKFQDLVIMNSNNQIVSEKNVTITWEVPNLKKDLGDIYVLHLSTERNVWEFIKPDNIDFQNRLITTTFKDLSPVAVVYKSKVENPENAKTNDNNDMYIYISTTLVAIGVIGYIVYKNKKKNKK